MRHPQGMICVMVPIRTENRLHLASYCTTERRRWRIYPRLVAR